MSYHARSEIALNVGSCVEQDGRNVRLIHLAIIHNDHMLHLLIIKWSIFKM